MFRSLLCPPPRIIIIVRMKLPKERKRLSTSPVEYSSGKTHIHNVIIIVHNGHVDTFTLFPMVGVKPYPLKKFFDMEYA